MSITTAADANAFIAQAITRAPDTYHLLPPRLRQVARFPYMAVLMAELGHPEADLRVAHIAGTSGKGSTATMLHAIARAAGIHAGLYTSPYLTRPQERIQIDDAPIADDLFTACTATVAAALARLKERYPDFEPHLKLIWVAVMLLALARARVELAVIEVGKGGLYDETNVVTPATATITTIGFDHMLSLGDSLAEIAFHKAGIIKVGAPVISGVTAAEPRAIIAAQARLAGVPVATIGADFGYDNVSTTPQGTRFDYVDALGGDIPGCQVPLIGSHYGHNAALAIRTARALWPAIGDNVLRAGLRRAWLPGRFELVGQTPLVILDVAHNADKMQALADTVQALYPTPPLWLVIGTMATKDSSHVLDVWQSRAPMGIICTEATMPQRAVTDAAALAREATALGMPSEVVRDPHAAVKRGIQAAGHDGLVIITGSLYLVGQIRDMLVAAAQR